MIAATDLRIGNLINPDRVHIYLSAVKVLSISETSFTFSNPENNMKPSFSFLKGASGVPIEEGWLLKFGFTPYGNHQWELGKYWVHCDIKDVFSFNYSGVSMDYDGDELYELVEIKYVHQLQNLYYALTGTELIYKN
jgi:hypothetical protein